MTHNRQIRNYRKILSRIGLYSLVLLLLAWTLGPFAWLFITSISTPAKLNQIPIQWLPQAPTFEHYRAMFDPSNPTGELFLAALRNSITVAGSTTLLCLLFGVLAAYALASFRFPAKQGLTLMMLATRLLPTIALVIPFYVIIVNYIDPIFPLFDTKRNLIALYTSFIIGLVVWIMRGYFATIPKELEEAALMDGCTRLQALFYVILPLSLPGLVTTALLAFLLAWDEFLLAMIFSRTANAFTLPYFVFVVGSSQYYQSPAAVAAGGVLAALPPVILAFVFQRQLVRGLTAGAISG
ncbi:MAG TPA: carbohydrate ABC transporter permease [Thermoflexia bacterium]|nr:carbohydrate ABC transporter permease [Thermoflexia bacterium]